MIYHVLIVDDEPIVRQGLLNFDWEKYGFEAVHACNNGREALQWLNANQVELVVTDIKMPGIDGVELSGKIRELNPDTLVVLLTGYNEFAYARQAIQYGVFDYLLKPAADEDFDQVLGKAYKELKNREEKKKIHDTMTYHFILRNQLNESHLSAETFNLDVYPEHPYRLFLVYPSNDKVEPELTGMPEKFVQINKREWIALVPDDGVQALAIAIGEAGMDLGISSVKHNRNEIPGAFWEANQALKQKFLFADRSVFHYSEQSNEENQLQLITGILKKVIHFTGGVNGINVKLMNPFLAGIMEEIKAKGISAAYIKQLISTVISAMERKLEGMPSFPAEEWSRKKEQFLHVVQTAKHLDVIEQSLFTEICAFMEEAENRNSQNKESAKLQEVLEYIHDHYNGVVSLDVISEYFRMHPNTFSKWFKESKGINFIDYLTRYRIDQARDLLEKTDFKLSQIAEAVGFQDPRYFGQVFKKLVDLTPSEYRSLFK